ncbi:MAG: hypothetical protein QOE40_430 [Actinomycetota bacterium]|nr:hypothetical protein [Actinomycetota bacterium]
MSDLTSLFAPRGIAVVGASSRPGKLGAVMVDALAGFPGTLVKVNARRPDRAVGLDPDLDTALARSGGPVDLVISCVPAAATAAVVAEAAAHDVGAVLACAGGFAEAGAAGREHELALGAVIARTGVRLLGPNTSGFLVPHRGLTATFVPGVRHIPAGGVAVVAASGGVNHALCFALAHEGIGVRLGVGLGNSLDVTQAEVLDHLSGDQDLRVVALHVETAADGRGLVEAVRRLTARVPVVALVVGRSDVGDFARSHTGALATSWRVTRAALRQAGAVLVDDERSLVDAVAALSRTRLAPSAGTGVGVVTAQAGPGLLLTDALQSAGLVLPPLAAHTVTRLGQLLPDLTYQRNPVDTGRPDHTLPDVVRAVAEDPGVDVVALYALLEPVLDLPAALAGTPGPVLAATTGLLDEVATVRAALAAAGVASFTTAAALATALRALHDDAVARWRAASPAAVGLDRRLTVREPVDEHTAKQLVAGLGIATPRGVACGDRRTAHTALDALTGPVAVKLLDAAVLHKTEIGGVRLGVRSHADLEAALDHLELAGATAFLVEEQAPPGPDLLAGARRDPVFGPVVLLGLGGTDAEAFDDVTVRLAPLSSREAGTMLDDLAARALAEGWRSGPAVDRTALATALVTLGEVIASDPTVAEVELNPLRVLADGTLLALDAVVLPSVSEQERSYA